jgi:hypothetical protein
MSRETRETKEIRLRLMKSAYESDLAEYAKTEKIKGLGPWHCATYYEEFLERKRKAIEQLEAELKEENA